MVKAKQNILSILRENMNFMPKRNSIFDSRGTYSMGPEVDEYWISGLSLTSENKSDELYTVIHCSSLDESMRIFIMSSLSLVLRKYYYLDLNKAPLLSCVKFTIYCQHQPRKIKSPESETGFLRLNAVVTAKQRSLLSHWWLILAVVIIERLEWQTADYRLSNGQVVEFFDFSHAVITIQRHFDHFLSLLYHNYGAKDSIEGQVC